MSALTARERRVLRGVADEEVYRTWPSGAVKFWAHGSGTDVAAAVRALVAAGLVDEPPEGGSFYTLTAHGWERLAGVIEATNLAGE